MFNTTYNYERPPMWERGKSLVMAKFSRIVCLFAPGVEEKFSSRWYFDGNNKKTNSDHLNKKHDIYVFLKKKHNNIHN